MKHFSQKSPEGRIWAYINKNRLINPGETIIVALSGGADSVFLLSILLSLKDIVGFTVAACHYNHRLRGEESDHDEEFVKQLCKKRGVECLFDRAEKEKMYKNEEEARNGRYLFFEKILKNDRGVKVATAHNLNDLIETFLLRLVRGSGLKGLSSISPSRENFIRPLLHISRPEIEEYLKKNDISFQTDRTNMDLTIDRNFIRHKIIPELTKLNPNLLNTLERTINLIQIDYEFLQSEAERELEKINESAIGDKVIIERKKWIGLHPAMRMMLIKLGLERLGYFKDITQKQLDEVYEIIEKGVGKKHKLLPHSLRIELVSGKIIMFKNKKGEII